MTENNDVRTDPTQPQNWPAPPPQGYDGLVTPTGAPVPAAYGGMPTGPIGQVRSTGMCFLLCIVTFGIYSVYYFYKTHEEMKRHTGAGLGGGVALVLGLFISIVMYFLTPNEINEMHERRGMRSQVSGTTGLWALLLGWVFGLGLIVWFVKVNGALNEYWRSQGAV